MVEFKCVTCGERVERDVLPGKHCVLGSLATINRTANCCKNPNYTDSTGFRQNTVDRNLRDLIPSLRA